MNNLSLSFNESTQPIINDFTHKDLYLMLVALENYSNARFNLMPFEEKGISYVNGINVHSFITDLSDKEYSINHTIYETLSPLLKTHPNSDYYELSSILKDCGGSNKLNYNAFTTYLRIMELIGRDNYFPNLDFSIT